MSNILKQKRQELGLTQKQLAEKIGIPSTTIRDYEQGRRSLAKAQACVVVALADILKTTPKELIATPLQD